MYLPRSLLPALHTLESPPEPSGPLQERLALLDRPTWARPLGSESLGSIRRIRWRAISRLRRVMETRSGGTSWNS